MLAISNPLTYDAFPHVRGATNDQTKVIEGELVGTPFPSSIHQAIVLRLTRAIDRVPAKSGNDAVLFAPIDGWLAPDTIVQPDAVVLLEDQLSAMVDCGGEGFPSIAIAVLSPSSSRRDLIVKRRLFATHDVAEYWIVDPAGKTVTINTEPADGHYRPVVTSLAPATSVLPGRVI